MSEVQSQPFEEQRVLAEKALKSRQWPRHICEQIATAFLGLLEAYALSQEHSRGLNEELSQAEGEIASYRQTMKTLHEQKIQQFELGRAAGESERVKLGEDNKNLSIELMDIKHQLDDIKHLTRNHDETKQLLSVWLQRWQAEIDRTPESLVDRTAKLLQLDNT
jgi:hypothetical protein